MCSNIEDYKEEYSYFDYKMALNIDASYVKSLTVDKLKMELRSRSLSTRGKKAELRKRLLKANVGEEEEVIVTSEYVNKLDFDILMQDFIEFKENICSKVNLLQNSTAVLPDELLLLQTENSFLKQELQNKQTIIDILSKDLKQNANESNTKVQDQSWQQISSNMSRHIVPVKTCNSIKLDNKFNALDIQENNDEVMITEEIRHRRKKSIPHKIQNDSVKRNGFPIDHLPERNMNEFLAKDDRITIPGNSNYADIVANGKKITIFGDSIIKRINGKELSKHVKNGRTFIKSFPGARSKAINHYVVPTLIDENPDVVVIHSGTNNIRTRRGQPEETIEKIAQEIIDIGRTCRQVGGVNNIFISAITCRAKLEESKKAIEINDMLKDLCVRENFVFISNDSIRKEHLWIDGLHLLDEGTTILANNIINSLNDNLL